MARQCTKTRETNRAMNDAQQTPVQEAISIITIAAFLVAVGCYVAATANVPIASPALFWVASLVYHWFPALNALKAPQIPMLVSAASVGCGFFLVAIPFAGVLAAWFSRGYGRERAINPHNRPSAIGTPTWRMEELWRSHSESQVTRIVERPSFTTDAVRRCYSKIWREMPSSAFLSKCRVR
jgi:hypothetical protein